MEKRNKYFRDFKINFENARKVCYTDLSSILYIMDLAKQIGISSDRRKIGDRKIWEKDNIVETVKPTNLRNRG